MAGVEKVRKTVKDELRGNMQRPPDCVGSLVKLVKEFCLYLENNGKIMKGF